MENKNNTTVGEENLANVTGGADEGLSLNQCFFTPAGSTRTSEVKGQTKMFALCASNCMGLIPCRCHGKDWCTGKWHEINPETDKLLPFGYVNHDRKNPNFGYNT